MSDEWFYKLFDAEFGPVRLDELVEFVRTEQLAAEDQVKLGTGGMWRRVGSIGRLVAAIPYQAVEKRIVPTVTRPRATTEPRLVDTANLSTSSRESDLPQARLVSRSSSPALAGPKDHARLGEPTPAPSAPTQIESRGPVRPSTVARVQPRMPEPGTPEPGTWSSPQSANRFVVAGLSRPVVPATKPVKPPRPTGPSWCSRVLDHVKEPKAIGGIVAVALVALFFGWGYLPQSRGADLRRYQSLKQVLTEFRSARQNPSTLATLKTKAAAVGKEVTDAVKKQAGRDDRVKQCLLWVARDELPRLLNAAPEGVEIAEKGFAARLQEAAVELGLEPRPVITLAQSAPLPDD